MWVSKKFLTACTSSNCLGGRFVGFHFRGSPGERKWCSPARKPQLAGVVAGTLVALSTRKKSATWKLVSTLRRFVFYVGFCCSWLQNFCCACTRIWTTLSLSKLDFLSSCPFFLLLLCCLRLEFSGRRRKILLLYCWWVFAVVLIVVDVLLISCCKAAYESL